MASPTFGYRSPYRSPFDVVTPRTDWAAYSAAKRQLESQGLSPEQYERKARQLAEAFGL